MGVWGSGLGPAIGELGKAPGIELADVRWSGVGDVGLWLRWNILPSSAGEASFGGGVGG